MINRKFPSPSFNNEIQFNGVIKSAISVIDNDI